MPTNINPRGEYIVAKLETISGDISRLGSSQSISGQMHGGRGQINTSHRSTFSIGSQAAQINGTGGQHLAEGDHVIAVGSHTKKGIFHVAAFKNTTNNVLQQGSSITNYVMGVLCILFGVLTFFLIITPVFFIPLGLFAIWGGIKQRKANNLLASSM